MSRFEENLQNLKQNTDQVAKIELYGDGFEPEHEILNQPGQAASLAIYYEVAVEFGGITPKSAEKAIELYAEKADEAKANPGQHPNIDRLFEVIKDNRFYSLKAINKA